MVRRAVTIFVSMITAVILSFGIAFAVVEYPPEGGKWDYGTDSEYIWSNYSHKTRHHGSSVRNCHGDLRRSVNVGPGEWSHASREDGCKGKIDRAYYRVI